MQSQHQTKFEQAAKVIMSISDMINRFTERNIDVSDDILRQLIVNKFKKNGGNRANNVIQYINQQNVQLASLTALGTNSFDGFMIRCRILSLCLADSNDEDLKREAHKILLDLIVKIGISTLSTEQKKLNELAVIVALGRFSTEYIKNISATPFASSRKWLNLPLPTMRI